VAVLLLLVLIWSASAVSSPHAALSPHPTLTTASPLPVNLSVSPLLFGTNLSLLSSQDQVLTSMRTQDQLAQIHVQIIRMPVRSNLSEATEMRAAQIIKSLNAMPVVDLEGSLTSDALTEDTRIVNDMNRVFGKSTVYYEYGDEEDLLSVSAQSYTSSWNAVIPSLKKLAFQGKFVGPVTYDYNQDYLATFLKLARPRPDLISWHEYTCAPSDSPATCLANIKNWGGHIINARAVMNTTLGTVLPIMISEWNYAPERASTTNSKGNESQSGNQTFVNNWTVQAFETLAANHVFASMQYSCTGSTALVDNQGNLTAQGTVFLNLYHDALGNKQVLAATPTATSPAAATAATSPASGIIPTPTTAPTPTPTTAPTPTPTTAPTPTPTTAPAPPGLTQPTSPPGAKWWVTTFANAKGYFFGGTLYSGTNYVFCKEWGPEIRDSAGNYNHWWLWTDMDTRGQDYVSAYYLKFWGNDIAKDNSGNVIPNC
jgi:hypothetical protein